MVKEGLKKYRFFPVARNSLKSGAEGQNRTVDTSLFRAVLYQLSYLGTSKNKTRHFCRNDRRKSSSSGLPNLDLYDGGEWNKGFRSSKHCLAEREGFEPSVEVLAPTTV